MELLVLSILILLNGFFALSEIGLVSSKRVRLEQRRQEGSLGAKTALKLLDDSENFLSAIQVGITLIGIVTGVYGGMRIADDIAPIFQSIPLIEGYAGELALLLTVVIITYFSIVIGELVPKTIALGNPEGIAIGVAPLIYFFSRLFYPFVKILSASTNFVNRAIGIKKNSEQLTESELKHMIKVASNEGVIEKEQNIIHEKIFHFSDKRAKHLMTHRTDVEWVDIDKPEDEVIEQLSSCQHSKIICCRGELDNFAGVMVLNDFYKRYYSNRSVKIVDLIHEPLVLPESSTAQKVLSLMRKNKTHICCVVNEYGGFEGLITLHDILEQIVGQIPDADEVSEPDMFVRDDMSVLVNGEAPVETLNQIIEDFEVDFEKIEYSTVAGFLFSRIGNIPKLGDKIDYMGHVIEVVDLDGHKIDKVLITKKS